MSLLGNAMLFAGKPESTLLSGLVAYWPLDTNSVDAVGGQNGTDTAMAYGFPGQFGGAAVFAGTGKIVLPDAFHLSTFSFSAWVWTPDNVGSEFIFQNFWQWYTTKWNAQGFYVDWVNGNFQFLVLGDNYDVLGVDYAQIIGSSLTIIDQYWHHVVATYDGAFLRLYVDGASDATPVAAPTVPIAYNASNQCRIGNLIYSGGETYQWNGRIAENYLWNRALTSTEVTELYNDGAAFFGRPFTGPGPGFPTGCVSFYKLDGNSNDAVGTNNGADTSISYVAGLLGQCATFNGINSVIDLGTSASLDLQNGDFSISFWVKPNTYNRGILSRSNGTNASIKLTIDNSGHVTYASDRGESYTTGSWSLPTGFWTHVLLTHDAAHSAIEIYFNGNPTNTTTATASGGGYVGEHFYLGPDSFSSPLAGQLDMVGIFNKVLTEVERNYLFHLGRGINP